MNLKCYKFVRGIAIFVFSCLFLTLTLTAQTSGTEKKPAPAVEKKAGGKELGVQWPAWFQPTMAIRGRWEQPWGRGYAQHNEDLYYLVRFAIGAKITANRNLNFFVMGQDTRVWFYNDLKGRPRGMKDTFDLRQLYMDVHGKQGKTTLALRVGRQYLDFGSRRMVAVPGWGNSTAVYDATRFSAAGSSFKVDLFASARVYDIFTYKFNRSRPGDNLYGVYTEFNKLIPHSRLEPYVYWRTQPLVSGERGDKGDSDLWSYGVRWIGKLPAGVDYSLEEVLQKGSYASDRIIAFGMIYQIGYQFGAAKWKPRIGMDLNYASGDKAKGDGKRGTFDQLYPSNHNVFGMADQVGWRNLLHWKWFLECTPRTNLKLILTLNNMYLATLQDGLYNSSGSVVVRNPKATSRHIGWEPDMQLDYSFSKKLTAGVGIARLFPGKFLTQSTPGHAYTYPCFMWEYKF